MRRGRFANRRRLGQRLNALFQRSFPDAPKYLVHLSSTGTEAVEAAIKHALLDYVERRKVWSTTVEKVLVDRIDQREDEVTVEPLRRWKHTIDTEQPILLAVRESYHGKTRAPSPQPGIRRSR
jgi:acetylornithine/succinyldiaminopimelate/putrescine aminotransferase